MICKLDYEVRAMYRYAVKGEEGVEDWAYYTALWYTSVQGKGGGVVVVDSNRLWSVSE